MTSRTWVSDVLDPAAAPWDLVVVGGGTAGIVAAKTAAATGARVLLIERQRPGGDCLWTGCVPSKTLLSAAHGSVDRSVPVDFAAVMHRVHAAIAEIEPIDSPDSLRAAGVTVVRGDARFVGPRSIAVAGSTVTFHRAIVATGCAPHVPSLDELVGATVVTSDTVWDLATLPPRLLVVGGGSIGCELAQAFARLGSAVTVVEQAERLLAGEDPVAAVVVADALVADGISVVTGTQLTRDHVAAADVVVVATGRTPRTDTLDLAAAGVAVTERGHVVVDSRLRTTNRRVWAAGDITGHPAFTHLAGVHGSLAATNAVLGLRRTVDLSAVPHVVFTQPELAAVGVDRASDAAHHERIIEHADVDRAVAASQPGGFTRLVLDRRGRVIGGCIVGPRAGESLAEVTLAVQHRMKARDLAAVIHPYPTYGDGVWNAALAQLRDDLTSPTVRRATAALLWWRRRLS